MQLVKDTKTCLKCENQSKVFSLVLLDAKPGIFSLCMLYACHKNIAKSFPMLHPAGIFYFWSGF